MNSMAEQIWLIIGLSAQLLFVGRWVVQWLVSEKRRKSTIPMAFWYFSLIGGLMLLAYAVYRKDPVFILGQSAGAIVYLRNLYFIHVHITEKQ
jgi:lipid-A-disaccharide synthase-like uncharacterized protein